MDKVAILIPCYNEAKTIAKVVSDFKREIPEAIVYVYDNNSSDETAKIAQNSGAIVRHEYQQGKGNVIRKNVCRNRCRVLRYGGWRWYIPSWKC